MKDITGYNDRCRLVLLDKKASRTRFEQRKLNKLKYRYSNYDIYEEGLLKELEKEGFVDLKGLKEATVDDNGHIVPADGTGKWPDPSEIYYVTNEKGCLALVNGYYQSEYSKRFFETKFVRIGIVIGAIGGLISVIVTLLELIKRYV